MMNNVKHDIGKSICGTHISATPIYHRISECEKGVHQVRQSDWYGWNEPVPEKATDFLAVEDNFFESGHAARYGEAALLDYEEQVDALIFRSLRRFWLFILMALACAMLPSCIGQSAEWLPRPLEVRNTLPVAVGIKNKNALDSWLMEWSYCALIGPPETPCLTPCAGISSSAEEPGGFPVDDPKALFREAACCYVEALADALAELDVDLPEKKLLTKNKIGRRAKPEPPISGLPLRAAAWNSLIEALTIPVVRNRAEKAWNARKSGQLAGHCAVSAEQVLLSLMGDRASMAAGRFSSEQVSGHLKECITCPPGCERPVMQTPDCGPCPPRCNRLRRGDCLQSAALNLWTRRLRWDKTLKRINYLELPTEKLLDYVLDKRRFDCSVVLGVSDLQEKFWGVRLISWAKDAAKGETKAKAKKDGETDWLTRDTPDTGEGTEELVAENEGSPVLRARARCMGALRTATAKLSPGDHFMLQYVLRIHREATLKTKGHVNLIDTLRAIVLTADILDVRSELLQTADFIRAVQDMGKSSKGELVDIVRVEDNPDDDPDPTWTTTIGQGFTLRDMIRCVVHLTYGAWPAEKTVSRDTYLRHCSSDRVQMAGGVAAELCRIRQPKRTALSLATDHRQELNLEIAKLEESDRRLFNNLCEQLRAMVNRSQDALLNDSQCASGRNEGLLDDLEILDIFVGIGLVGIDAKEDDASTSIAASQTEARVTETCDHLHDSPIGECSWNRYLS